MIRLFLSSVFLLASTLVLAQPTQNELDGKDQALGLNTITTAVPFMGITPDSRAGGMGDAGTALSANSNSLYWNTSMLNFSEDESEISVSYTPWLRQLTNDIHLSYISGYYKLNDKHAVGGALRYFHLGEITFTDESGNIIRNDKPNEFEVTGGYAFKTSQRTSVGLNGKFAYSNLTGGLPVAGVNTKAGIAGAADISFTFFNDDARIGGSKGEYTFATTINNIGNKIRYSDGVSGEKVPGDFLPTNLKIGNAYKFKFDKYNDLTVSIDLQKLLVPTPPIYNDSGQIISGRTDDVGVVQGMVQSFYDAPGTIATDEAGNPIETADGFETVGGSKFKEELTEINIGAGLEYWYADIVAIRAGYFYEANNKGARQYFNFGAGFKYNKFGIDISYLAAMKRNNPLANTLRFTLRMTFGGPAATEDEPSVK